MSAALFITFCIMYLGMAHESQAAYINYVGSWSLISSAASGNPTFCMDDQ